MVEFTAFVALVSMYLLFKRDEPLERQAVFATLVMGAYLATYWFVPPTLTVTTRHLGQIFGFVPLMSFGAILFPELNPKSPPGVTRFLGWTGLVMVFAILCILKAFVW